MSSIKTQYDEQGYVSPLDGLNSEELAAAQAALNELEQAIDEDKRGTGLMGCHIENRVIWDVATHPVILDAVSQAYGENIVLTGTHFFNKYPSADSKFVAWHQDVTYWGLEPMRAITAWLAFDDADAENGCMRVIPGSHKLGLLDHGKSDKDGNLLSVNQAIADDKIDESTAVDICLKAGQFSLHDGMTIHGSNPNRSTRRRAGLTLRYTSADVRFTNPDRRKPHLVRGELVEGGMVCDDLPFELIGS